MFIFADIYFAGVEGARVVLFHGRVGSYKTLSAVSTAHALLKTRRYKQLMCNFPCTFASSPPLGIDHFDFMNESYASDTVFIIDEAALFLSGKHEEVKKIFAFPRKLNQVFLLCSVLPVKEVTNYAHFYVKRHFNLSMIGIPAMSFFSSELPKVQRKDMVQHWIFNYSQYFQKYASKYRPDQLYPIEQWRDRGALYDKRSRRIDDKVVKFYYMTSWGLAEKRDNLKDFEKEILDTYMPDYDTSYIFDTALDLPRLKKKMGFNFIGSEFQFAFFFQVILMIYVAFIIGSFVFHLSGREKNFDQWTKQDYINFFTGKRLHFQEKGYKGDDTKTTQPTIIIVTPTPKVVEYTQE